jgi:UDP-N-acetylmuramate dehydrogenase
MIEAVGCKGSRQGQAQVSEQHANFIVNTGGATASQVWRLIEQVQRQVWQEERVWLEPEVRRVGEW